jgi:putative ABC transport system permease protein
MDRGRAFNDEDVASGAPVTVVNEAFVQQYMGKIDPLTQQVLVPQFDPMAMKLGSPVTRQIVGVFHNVRNEGPRQTDVPEIDVPFWQFPLPFGTVAVHPVGDPRNVIKDVGAAVQAIDSDLPLVNVETMDQFLPLLLARDRWVVAVYAGFGLAALLLAGIGVVIGVAGALALTRLMRAFLFGVSVTDPVTFGGVVVLLVTVAAIACLVPAQRAMRVDPLVALRHE